MTYLHQTVMLKEAINGLAIRADGLYVDCTFGAGGHSRAILEQLGQNGSLLAFDKDSSVQKLIDDDLQDDPRFRWVHGSFTRLVEVIKEMDKVGQVAGVLFDLGISSMQIDDPERGFSFRHDGHLDMRMAVDDGKPISHWLNHARESDIADVIYQYGEERAARRIARAIIAKRKVQKIDSTKILSQLVCRVVKSKPKGIHPATLTFQALRIFINQELEELRSALKQVVSLLDQGGRLVAISFHSLEDRIVKRFIRDSLRSFSSQSLMEHKPSSYLKPVGKKQRPTEEEVQLNKRSRSDVVCK